MKPRGALEKNGLETHDFERIETHGPDKRSNYSIASGDYFLSIYDSDAGDRTTTEAEIYGLINQHTSLRAPEVIDYEDRYILVNGLEGRNYSEVFEDADRSERKEIVELHADALAEIHGIPVERFGRFTSNGFENKNSWKEFVEDRLGEYSGRVSGEFEEEALNWLQERISSIGGAEPAVVHDDFHVWNTLTGERLGVLDAEQGFLGSKEYDLAKTMTRWTDDSDLSEIFLERYMENARLRGGFQGRLDYYRIEILLRGVIEARQKDLQNFYRHDLERLEEIMSGTR